VYCNPFYDYAGYGNVFSVNSSGHIEKNIQNYEYCEKTAIHGMVFSPDESYLYSADMWANRVWCHKKIEEGKMETVGYTEAPAPKDHPRWVEMHPSGNYLYALMEGGNRLCEYVIDPQTKLPIWTYKTYPLIPPGKLLQTPHRRHALTGIFRHTQRRHNVSLRRLLPHKVRAIPLRNLALQLLFADWLHRCLQDCTIGRYRATNMPQSNTHIWRTLKCCIAMSLER
jgi:hypothetical protein